MIGQTNGVLGLQRLVAQFFKRQGWILSGPGVLLLLRQNDPINTDGSVIVSNIG